MVPTNLERVTVVAAMAIAFCAARDESTMLNSAVVAKWDGVRYLEEQMRPR